VYGLGRNFAYTSELFGYLVDGDCWHGGAGAPGCDYGAQYDNWVAGQGYNINGDSYLVPGVAAAVVAHRGGSPKPGPHVKCINPGKCFRGAKPGESPTFVPRPNDYKVDPKTGFVRETHGVSVFDNSGSVSSKGFIPHRIDESSFPGSLRVIQRGKDLRHFEIVPVPGANLTPERYAEELAKIRVQQ
jgi:hypothetical protein